MATSKGSSAQSKSKRRTTGFKVGQFNIMPGQALTISPLPATKKAPKAIATREKTAAQIGSVIKAYLNAGHELLSGTYEGVKDLAPPHLAKFSRAIVISCKDGVVVRYESSPDDADHVIAGYANMTTTELAKQVSEFAIYCVPSGAEQSSVDISAGPKLQILSQKASGESSVLFESIVCFLCKVKENQTNSHEHSLLRRRNRLLGVENSIVVGLLAETVHEGSPPGQGQRFLTQSTVRLPVGWEYFEIYLKVDLNHWKEEFASSWAEADILGWVMRTQLRKDQLRALDPNVDARKDWARLFDEYENLLSSDPHEEILQEFLAKNPTLLSPTHVRFWPKVSFGDRVSDFVFREAAGDYLLVEIERPSKKLFIKTGDTSSALNHAQNQIADWKRYIEDNLNTVQTELGLDNMTPNPKSLVVIGRSKTVSEEGKRKLGTMRSDNPRQTIMTYDDVLDNAKAAVENILGPLWAAGATAEVYFLPNRPSRPSPLPRAGEG